MFDSRVVRGQSRIVFPLMFRVISFEKRIIIILNSYTLKSSRTPQNGQEMFNIQMVAGNKIQNRAYLLKYLLRSMCL